MNWTLVRKIGSGTYGEVWEAKHSTLQGRYVLKLLYPYIDKDVSSNEANRIKDVGEQSLNVARIMDAGYSKKHRRSYIAMNYFSSSVERLLKQKKTASPPQWLTLDEAYALLQGALEGVGDAHRADIIHGDLKPANIMLDDQQNPKLADFGAARTVTGDNDFAVRGSSTWAAPETLSPDEVPPTKASDLFSLGVIGYMLLTGRHPFFSDDPACVIGEDDNIRNDSFRPTSIGDLNSRVDSDVAALVERLLDRVPENRHEAFARLETRLADLLAPVVSTVTPSAAPPVPPIPPGALLAATPVPFAPPALTIPVNTAIAEALGSAKVAFFRRYQPEEALTILERIISERVDNHAARRELADCYSLKAYIHNNRREYPAAIQVATKGLEIITDHVPLLHTRAWASFKSGKFSDAEADINRALSLDLDERRRRQLVSLLSEIRRRTQEKST